ncbi:MAG TPA: TIGR03435 family protein [Acidobacteriaceae bacterium]|nr:TIGR03435 family protein [Acidobacteriaceae bacterium]
MLAATFRRASLSLPLLIVVGAPLQGRAQAQAPGKTFDVVSIRQNVSQGRPSGPPNLGPTPNGFHIERQSLISVLLVAYTPKAGGLFMKNIQGLPEWASGRERYDIDARISDADRAAWNDPKNQPAMLQEMLQAMLADRFKLSVHREMKEVPVYELVVAKGGVKFHETKPDEPKPAGATLPGGGMMGPGPDGATHMYNFSMNLLCALLSEKSERPVVDKTGLTGHYSIDIREPAQMAAPSASPNGPTEDDRMPAVADVLKSVGLELKPAKEQVEWLVIDHIEKPTAN